MILIASLKSPFLIIISFENVIGKQVAFLERKIYSLHFLHLHAQCSKVNYLIRFKFYNKKVLNFLYWHWIECFVSWHQMAMDLTFSEAARGVNKEVTVNLEDTCERCKGSRAEPGTKTSKCHQCNGTGQVSACCLSTMLSLFKANV